MYSYFGGFSPVFIDGLLYVMIAVCGAMLATFTSDDAYKYINIYILYWLKEGSGWGLALFTAIKMFRSTGYAEHRVQKDKEAVEEKRAAKE